MRTLYVTICFIILNSPITSIKALAQADSGQDMFDSRQDEIDDQDRWLDAEMAEYCKTHKHEKGCFKTAEQITKQKEADIAVPIVVLGLVFGGFWISQKIKHAERPERNKKNR